MPFAQSTLDQSTHALTHSAVDTRSGDSNGNQTPGMWQLLLLWWRDRMAAGCEPVNCASARFNFRF